MGQRLRRQRQPQFRAVHEGHGRQDRCTRQLARRRHKADHRQLSASGRRAAVGDGVGGKARRGRRARCHRGRFQGGGDRNR